MEAISRALLKLSSPFSTMPRQQFNPATHTHKVKDIRRTLVYLFSFTIPSHYIVYGRVMIIQVATKEFRLQIINIQGLLHEVLSTLQVCSQHQYNLGKHF